MKPILKIVTIITAGLVLALGTSAFDLPVKRIKGKEYYYYKVKKGESLYGISKKLEIPLDSIVRANPSVSDGVRKSDMLLFPVGEKTTEISKTKEADKEIVNGELNDPSGVQPEENETARPKNSAVAILLPFGADNAEPDKRCRLMLDFYKGFLIAADSLRERKGNVEIVVRDIEGMAPESVARMISTDTAIARAAVVIGPDDDATLNAIAAEAATGGSYVFNVLNIRDTVYTVNPYMLQANAPQLVMFGRAVNGLLSSYPGYHPVILRNTAGRSDKENFTAYLTERYISEGIEPLIVEYNENLLMADLEALPCSAGEKYVFIPSSGSLQEFNHFAYVLKSYRDRLRATAAEAIDTAAENGETAACAMAEIFGYPDWTAFRGDALDMLHRLNATVYSRFFDDFTSFDSRNLNAAFRRWYGAPMTESIPAYGILGFDTGTYLLKNLRSNDGAFNPGYATAFSGVQSSFDFVRAGEGYANEAIYIITYQPDGRISARVQ